MRAKKINSLKELYNILEEDKRSDGVSARRYPIRFIFVNSFEELREIIKHLNRNYTAEYKEIIELLPAEDRWVTTSKIIDWIKKIHGTTIVVGLSGILRFQGKDDFHATFKGLTEIEAHSNIRIYIPLVGLWERFEQEFWNNFYRREEWAPVWKLESPPQKITIYQANFNLNRKVIPLENFTVISTAEEWLNVWKKRNVNNILSLSKPLSYFCKNFLPDQAFTLREISNQKEFLEEIFKIKVPIAFREDEKIFWDKLVEEMCDYKEKGLTLSSIFSRHFNLRSEKKLTVDDFVDIYLRNSEDYERWLIKNLFLSLDKFKSSYLYKCFGKVRGYKKEDLIEELWCEIFHMPLEMRTEDVFFERRRLLSLIYENHDLPTQFVEGKLVDKFAYIESYPLRKKIHYLTNITFAERKYIISELRNVEDIQIQEVIPDLKKVYPELVYYLDWDLIKPDEFGGDSWIVEYFKEYNYSKVKHAKSSKIEELINSKNKNKSVFSDWYYSLSNAEKELEDGLRYVWVDGLGAEWFPLIVHLINEYGKESGRVIKKKMLTRAYLPSTTECNKYEVEKIKDLDDYIHAQKSYKHPDDLVHEIELIKKIVKRLMGLPIDRIGVVSDHGFSFLCLKDFGNFKRLDLPDVEHEGRCKWIDSVDSCKEDEYFIIWNVDEGNCKGRKALVALKHISLSNTPYREVHGGATPEEVLVPYLVIETEQDKTKYEIELIKSEVRIDNPMIRFKIYPQPRYIVEAFLNERPLNVSYEKENSIYVIDLKNLKVGTHTITLKIGNMKYQMQVTIKGGFKERDLL